MDNIRFNVEKGEIYSATGRGKIPWVSVRDIAAVAYRSLTDRVSHNTDHLITGPELLSYGDVRDRGKILDASLTPR
jgi:festuclavine dehydrogenase